MSHNIKIFKIGDLVCHAAHNDLYVNDTKNFAGIIVYIHNKTQTIKVFWLENQFISTSFRADIFELVNYNACANNAA